MIRKFLLSLCVLFLSLTAHADAITTFLNSMSEQSAAEFWIKSTAKGNITDADARLIAREVYANAYTHDLDPHLVLAVLRTESRFDAKARSHEGAKGLMQVIPRWHKDKLRGRDVFNARVNIEVGTQILADCFQKHKSQLRSLSCYSGGGGLKYAKFISDFNRVITSFVRENVPPPIVVAGEARFL